MIELSGLCAGYGKKQILHDLSLTFPKGKRISLLGPNGAGKSTVLKAAVRLIPRHSGRILLGGADIDTLSQGEIARKIAYLPQSQRVPDMTAGEMVLHGRFPHLSYPRRYSAKDRRIAGDAMEQMGIAHLAGEKMSALSGGMRQNVYIAMALAQDTPFILLDEPTAYLDISHQISLVRTLRTLADGGKGIVAVMHDLPLAFTWSELVYVIADGRLVLSGTPEEVSAAPCMKEIFGTEIVRDPADGSYRYKYCEDCI